jgi:glycosyltransferase involved in cell wall biosynthesis
MRTVSVITPVHEISAPYLVEAYKSLNDQEMPDGWQWRWLVQEDGEAGTIADFLPDDPRISYSTGRAGGPGVARTLALARADGELVKVLDADDQLTEGALARDIAILDEHQDVGWSTARVLDLLPDGSIQSWEHSDPPDGPIERGQVYHYWRNQHRLPVHPATLCIRRQLLLALGGWMALPTSEDTGLLIALNIVARGYFIGQPALLYRKWPGQITGHASHVDPCQRAERDRIIRARAEALLDMYPLPSTTGADMTGPGRTAELTS